MQAKASQPRLQTSPTAQRAGSGSLALLKPQQIVMSQPRLVTVRSEPRIVNPLEKGEVNVVGTVSLQRMLIGVASIFLVK